MSVYYQYFWVKIATKDEIKAQRSKALLDGTDERVVFSHPLTIGIKPPDTNQVIMAVAGIQFKIDLGFWIHPDMIRGKERVVDVVAIRTGYTAEQARGWIDEPPGQAWAGTSFCFLCYATVSPM